MVASVHKSRGVIKMATQEGSLSHRKLGFLANELACITETASYLSSQSDVHHKDDDNMLSLLGDYRVNGGC